MRIDGFDDICNVYNVEVKNSVFEGVTDGAFMLNGQTANVRFSNLKINSGVLKPLK